YGESFFNPASPYLSKLGFYGGRPARAIMKHLLASVDLGSNSFRLVIGRVVHDAGVTQLYEVDRLKETVRLAAGLDENRHVDEETIERAVAVLKRFGERLRSFHPD